MEYQQALQRLLLDDAVRMKALYAVQTLRLNDGWIGAGFVRDAVWDHLHGYGQRPVGGDVDVVWFDAVRCAADGDRLLEVALNQVSPAFDWSVKNQARMHHHSGNAPYRSTEDAIRYWPETATAVAVRIGDTGLIEVIAPYGLADLFALRLRPTPQFEQQRLSVFKHRVAAKRWVERYPQLQLIVPGEPEQGERALS